MVTRVIARPFVIASLFRPLRGFLCPLAAALALAAAPSAHASFTFTLGNHPQQPGEENVLVNKGETGTTVTGNTNQSGTLIDFTSTQTLNTPAGGQDRVIAVDQTGAQVALTDVTVSAPGNTFTDLIFNPHLTSGVGGVGSGGSADVTVQGLTAQGNPETGMFSYPPPGLGSGENFLSIVAMNGEKISSVSISAPGGFTDLEQVRVSGVTAIPEPASLVMMATGLGLVGLVLPRMRKRRRAA